MDASWIKQGNESSTNNTSFSTEKMDHFREHFQNVINKKRHIVKDLSAKERKKQKRYRSAFTTAQVTLLENEFKKNPYVSNIQREQMSEVLHLPERAIKIWFQNRRMKEKRDPTKYFESKILPLSNAETSISFTKQNLKSNSPKNYNQNDDKSSDTDSNYNTISQKINDPDKNISNTSNSEIVISKVADLKTQSDWTTKSAYTLSSGGTVRELNGVADIMNQVSTSIEKRSSPKQPVSHILPEPQKSPENLTFKMKEEKEPAIEVQSELDTQYHSYLPLDLTKYYATVPQTSAWNGLNLIPLISGATQGLPYNAQTVSTKVPNFAPKKCSCDCHSSSDGINQQRLQPPYPVVFTPYVPHIMTQMPPQYPGINNFNQYK